MVEPRICWPGGCRDKPLFDKGVGKLKSLIIIVLGLVSSWHFTQLGAASLFAGVIAPILVAVFLIALLLWLLERGWIGGRGYGDTGGFDSDGGDGGGD